MFVRGHKHFCGHKHFSHRRAEEQSIHSDFMREVEVFRNGREKCSLAQMNKDQTNSTLLYWAVKRHMFVSRQFILKQWNLSCSIGMRLGRNEGFFNIVCSQQRKSQGQHKWRENPHFNFPTQLPHGANDINIFLFDWTHRWKCLQEWINHPTLFNIVLTRARQLIEGKNVCMLCHKWMNQWMNQCSASLSS